MHKPPVRGINVRARFAQRCARMSERNPLDFALREDEEALKKGRDFSSSFLSLASLPSAGGVMRTQTITGEGGAK